MFHNSALFKLLFFNSTHILFTIVSLAFLFLVGCATPPISTAGYSPTGKGPQQSNNGVVVKAEIIDHTMFKALFGRDTLGTDVQAVYVQVLNNAEGRLYIVGPQSFYLSSGRHFSTDANKTAGQNASSTGAIGFLVTPLPVAVPLLVAGLGGQAENSVFVNNLTRRQLKTTTLQPGETTSGTLFFKVPLETLITTAGVEAAIDQAGTGEKLSFHLDFSTK